MSGGSVTRWWWLRHAPTAAEPGLIVGRLDLPASLTPVTLAPAVLADLARGLPLDAFWLSSPLSRCVETARALRAAYPSAGPIALEPDFAEQDFGNWQGQTHAALDAAGAPEYRSFWTDPARTAPPGGESFVALAARVREAILRYSQAQAGRDIVVVAHAGTIRAAIGLALDLTPAAMLRLAVEPLSLTRLDHIDGGVLAGLGQGVGVGQGVGEGVGAAWRVVTIAAAPALGASPSLPPTTLVLGGARSGKSRHAQAAIEALRPARAIYLATAEAGDDEMAARIAQHRRERGALWRTVEEPLDLPAQLTVLARGSVPVLIDCLTLWLANLMAAGRSVEAETAALIGALARMQAPVVLVANEVGLGIVPDNALAREFRDAAGRLNQAVALAAQRVVFLAAGLPMVLKG